MPRFEHPMLDDYAQRPFHSGWTKESTPDTPVNCQVLPAEIEEKIKTHPRWRNSGQPYTNYEASLSYCAKCQDRRYFTWHIRGQMGLCRTCNYPHPASIHECYGCDDEFFAFGRDVMYCESCDKPQAA